jgi:glycosyl transferase family 25
MKVVVISLRGSERRRANIHKQLGDVGLPFEFFNAVNGHDALEHVHHYDDAEFIRNCGRSATANEIGCYASHLALWKRCAEGDEPLLILEDDSRLDPGFVHGFGLVERRISRLGLVRVCGPYPDWSDCIEQSGPFDIRRCRRVPLLALAYALTPQAAARLATAGSIVDEPVDKFMQRFWRHKQEVVALHPPIVHASTLESDIGRRTRPHYTLRMWLVRLRRKCSNSLLREIYNLQMRARGSISKLSKRVPSVFAPES